MTRKLFDTQVVRPVVVDPTIPSARTASVQLPSTSKRTTKVATKTEKRISLGQVVDLLLIDRLHKMGGMSKLQLLQRGLSAQMIRQMESRGILRASPDAFGITQYMVVDDFLAKLT